VSDAPREASEDNQEKTGLFENKWDRPKWDSPRKHYEPAIDASALFADKNAGVNSGHLSPNISNPSLRAFLPLQDEAQSVADF